MPGVRQEILVMAVSGTQTTIEGQIGELRGEVNGLKSRMDDMHRLMMVMIGIAGAGWSRRWSGWQFSW